MYRQCKTYADVEDIMPCRRILTSLADSPRSGERSYDIESWNDAYFSVLPWGCHMFS
jgi:hypothetical protein